MQQTSGNTSNACINIHPTELKNFLNSEAVEHTQLETNNLFKVKFAGVYCESSYNKDLVQSESDAKFCYTIKCPEAVEGQPSQSQYEIDFNFLENAKPEFSVIGKVKMNGQQKYFQADQKRKVYNLESSASENFMLLGIKHIGASPSAWKDDEGQFQIADGIDHVLFILALLLVSVSWRSLVINISGFTVGHSVALALSLGQIIVLPAAYIEPAIAASIAYLAYKGLINKKESSLFLTTAFGVLHGMGFSYVLEGLKISDRLEFFKIFFLFNLGIEMGQLIILVLFTPLFIYLARKKKFSTQIGRSVSFVIFGFAIFWTLERLWVLYHGH